MLQKMQIMHMNFLAIWKASITLNKKIQEALSYAFAKSSLNNTTFGFIQLA
jgi:hypothetical protein